MTERGNMARPEIQNKQELIKLLDLLARVNYAVDVSPISDAGERERLWYANILTNKFIAHALTIFHLLNDTNVLVPPLSSFPPIRIINIASASIDVLTRASFEAFLVFHHVFITPTTTDEKNFRYWSYKAAGIMDWQKETESISEHEQEKAAENGALDELRTRLKSNAVFQSLAGKEDKKKILRGEWRLKQWHDIAIDAGFGKMLASQYRYLSGSAHSSNLSNLRMEQALENKEPKILIEPLINTMNILIANMIREYCALFPRSQDILSKDLEGKNLVEQWIQIGHQA